MKAIIVRLGKADSTNAAVVPLPCHAEPPPVAAVKRREVLQNRICRSAPAGRAGS